MVAQIDEQQTAMIAPPIDPAGQPDAAADVLLAQFAAGVGAIGVHGKSFKNGGMWRLQAPLVKGRIGRAIMLYLSQRRLRLPRALTGIPAL
jgi:hypothetical protein